VYEALAASPGSLGNPFEFSARPGIESNQTVGFPIVAGVQNKGFCFSYVHISIWLPPEHGKCKNPHLAFSVLSMSIKSEFIPRGGGQITEESQVF
jgi:hypothetical protein